MDNRRLDENGLDKDRLVKEYVDAEVLKKNNPMTASSLLVRVISIGIVWFVIYQLSLSMKVIMYVETGLFIVIKVGQLLTKSFWQRIRQPYEKTWFVFSILVPLSLFFFMIHISDVREREARAVGEQMITLINDYYNIHGTYPPTDAVQPIRSEKVGYDNGRIHYFLSHDGTPSVIYKKPMAIFCTYHYEFSTEQWEELCD